MALASIVPQFAECPVICHDPVYKERGSRYEYWLGAICMLSLWIMFSANQSQVLHFEDPSPVGPTPSNSIAQLTYKEPDLEVPRSYLIL